MIFDPGGNVDGILENFRRMGGQVLEGVYCTHGHADHILGIAELLEKCPAPLYFPREDMMLFNAVYQQCRMFGIPAEERPVPVPDHFVDQGDKTVLGQGTVICTPGHSVGSVCYYFEDEETIIGGDLLFHHSIGRTDLPGGSMEEILSSIREKIFVLPPQTIIISGHGPVTTVGEEKENNPFLF